MGGQTKDWREFQTNQSARLSDAPPAGGRVQLPELRIFQLRSFANINRLDRVERRLQFRLQGLESAIKSGNNTILCSATSINTTEHHTSSSSVTDLRSGLLIKKQ
ncbi:hypothetical protein SRHO_G00049620 [Serrasalmus rhombeus]